MGTIILKLIGTFFILGFMAIFFLWPSNEQPVATSNKIMFGIASLFFVGWLFNFY
jgi:ABC-type transport system involved in multi-copper enzyme maturation permease subunit